MQRRDRLLAVWLGALAALATFYFTDPDHGLATLFSLQNLLWVVVCAPLAYVIRRGLMDGARSGEAYRKALESPTGAGLVFLGLCLLVGILMLCLSRQAHAELPPLAKIHLPALVSEQKAYWPEAVEAYTLAGEVEQETCPSLKSSKCWNPKAELKTSREYGFGLGQITVTSKFDNFKEARRLHKSLADWGWQDRYNARFQLRTMVLTQKANWRRTSFAATARDRWQMTLNAYNGGYGGLQADRRLCAAIKGCDPSRWDGNVALHSTKSKVSAGGYSKSFYQISREYPALVLQRREKYKEAWL